MRLNPFTDIATPESAPEPRPAAPHLHDVAAALHRRRRDVGLDTYGVALTTGNGRDAAVDEIQEAADGLVYRLQRYIETRALHEALDEFSAALGEYPDDVPLLIKVVAQRFDALLGPSALRAREDRLADEMIEAAPR